MSDYFSKFPNVQYLNALVKDITRKNKFFDKYLSDPKLFLPYTVQEGERPEDNHLVVSEVKVDSARMLKRLRPAPQGRGHRIRKRSNHVTLTVDRLNVENITK